MWPRRHLYFFDVPEFNLYEGQEVSVKWVKPSQLALSTDQVDFPFRVIERRLIVDIDGQPYAYDVAPKEEPVRFVQGSRGRVYEVTGNYKCTCPGFTFRGACKHLEIQ